MPFLLLLRFCFVDNISLANLIVKCDLDVLHHLDGNAVSPGGTTTFPDIADRMQKDCSLSSVLQAISIIVYFAVDIPANICAPRAEIDRVDRWLNLGVPQHLPKHVVSQARV